MRQQEAVSRVPRGWMAAALAVLPGAALNLFPLPLDHHTALFAGGAISFLVLVLPGGMAGVASGVLITLPLLLAAGQWMAWAQAMVELLVVAGLVRRLRSVLLATLAGWACVGFPLLLTMEWRSHEHTLWECASIAVTAAAGRVVLAGLAEWGVRTLELFVLPADRSAPRRLTRLVFGDVLLASVLSIACVITPTVLVLRQEAKRRAAADLAADTARAAYSFSTYLQLQKALVESVARGLSVAGAGRGRVAEIAGEFHERHLSFITVLVTDAEGRVVHARRRSGDKSEEIEPLSEPVSDREYFRAARDSGQAYMSNAFQGRGFGADLIVAFSAPLKDAGGRFGGIVEGSLDLTTLKEESHLPVFGSGLDMVLLDGGGRVVYATQPAQFHALAKPEDGQWVRGCPAEEAQGGRELVRCAALAGSGWTIASSLDEEHIYEEMPILYGMAGAGFFASIGITLLIARLSSVLISRPVTALAEAVRDFRLDGDAPLAAPVEAGAVQEMADLSQAFDQLGQRLRESHSLLQQSLEAERELNQLRAKFVDTVSHEFRTPLTVIQSSTDLLERIVGRDATGKAATHFARIRATIRRMTGMLNDAISLSRIEAGAWQPELGSFDAAECCRTVFSKMEAEFGTRLASVELADRRARMEWRIDPAFFERIVEPLVSNALKYSPVGSAVVVSLREQDGFNLLVVEDAGSGIGEDERGHVREAFYRGANASGTAGAGLGLTIVSRLVEVLGGRLTIEGRPPRGTRVTVVLPGHRGEAG